MSDEAPAVRHAPRPTLTALFRSVGSRQAIQFAVDLGANIAITRLLTPAEIGTYSVAVASIIIIQALRTAGVNIYLIQCRDVGAPEISSALGLALTISLALGGVVVLAAPGIADFYHAPAIRDVLYIVSISFLFVPFQSIAGGMLARHLRLVAPGNAQIMASVGSAALGIWLAAHGVGAVSLAWASVVNTLVATGAMVWFARDLLNLRPRWRGWSAIVSTAGWTLAGTMTNQAGGRVNEIVIGKTLGVDHAAWLDRAELLPRMLWSYLAPMLLGVLTPAMASDLRQGADPHELLREKLRFFALIFVPAMIAIGTQSEPLLMFLYGHQWAASVEPALWVCIASACSGQFVAVNAMLVASGRMRDLFVITAVEQVARIVVLALFANISILATARALVLVALAYSLSAMLIARKRRLLFWRDIPYVAGPSTITALVMLFLGSWIAPLLSHLPPVIALISAAIMLALAWVVTAALVERRIIKILLQILRRD